MKSRVMVLTATIALLVTPLIAPAGAAPTNRTDTVAYDGPNVIMISVDSSRTQTFSVESDMVMPEAGENFVSIEIADDSGQPIGAEVHQGRAVVGTFCGSGEHLALVNNKPIHLHLQFGVSVDCAAPTVPTSGSITFTFH